jgi:hypothetical protein
LLQAPPDDWADALLAHLQQQLPSLSAAELSHTIWALATLKIKPERAWVSQYLQVGACLPDPPTMVWAAPQGGAPCRGAALRCSRAPGPASCRASCTASCTASQPPSPQGLKSDAQLLTQVRSILTAASSPSLAAHPRSSQATSSAP